MREAILAITIILLAAGLSSSPQADKTGRDPVILPKQSQLLHIEVNSFWRTNCYILAGKRRQAIVIDPGDELEMVGRDRYRATGEHAQRIYDLLQQHKLTLKYIVLTHGHLDHIGAIGFLKERTGAEIIMHAGDVRDGYAKDTHMFVDGLPKVDRTVIDGDYLRLDGMVLQVIHTPGHSPGGICLRTRQGDQPILFSGDTLIRRTVGRTNFRDGSGDQELLLKSIREKLYTLPDSTIVYAGHYPPTTIGEEKRENAFVRP
jgi:glyoxylase-like metal-dependent hydrolase (beta-lactamase superfamily II)